MMVLKSTTEAGTKVISVLERTPMLLVLLLLNVATLGMISYLLISFNATRHLERLELVKVVEQCLQGSKDSSKN